MTVAQLNTPDNYLKRPAFANLFKEGMALVEETAAYLDGPGRTESKKLERVIAIKYASESMRLTTRLMQIASWLLIMRSVKEGEQTYAQAKKDKVKIQLLAVSPGDDLAGLPETLVDLIGRGQQLALQIIGVEKMLTAGVTQASQETPPPKRDFKPRFV